MRWTMMAMICIFLIMEIRAQPVIEEGPAHRHSDGLIVCLWRTDLAYEKKLAQSGSRLIHILTLDERDVADKRERLVKDGLHGKIVVEGTRSLQRLPYPDHFVKTLIADLDHLKDAAPSREEMLRVLVPNGVAHFKRNNRWETVVRPRMKDIDDWTHKWHDATGNPLSQDLRAGPPTAVQWAHGPALRDSAVGGKMPRIGKGQFFCVNSGDGILFARDAGNGLLRWQNSVGLDPTNDLVYADGRLYGYFAGAEKDSRGLNRWESGPLVALDARTGKQLRVYDEGGNLLRKGQKEPFPVPWFVVEGSHIFQASGPTLIALDVGTGKVLWKESLDGATWFSPILLDGKLIAAECLIPAKRMRLDGSPDARAITAFDRKTGKQLWRTTEVMTPQKEGKGEMVPLYLTPLVGASGSVFLQAGSYQNRAPGAFVAALDAATGKLKWKNDVPDKQWTNTLESSRIVWRDGKLYYLGGRGIKAWDADTGKDVTEFISRGKYAFKWIW